MEVAEPGTCEERNDETVLGSFAVQTRAFEERNDKTVLHSFLGEPLLQLLLHEATASFH